MDPRTPSQDLLWRACVRGSALGGAQAGRVDCWGPPAGSAGEGGLEGGSGRLGEGVGRQAHQWLCCFPSDYTVCRESGIEQACGPPVCMFRACRSAWVCALESVVWGRCLPDHLELLGSWDVRVGTRVSVWETFWRRCSVALEVGLKVLWEPGGRGQGAVLRGRLHPGLELQCWWPGLSAVRLQVLLLEEGRR